jgi:UDP-N-acetyl-2-amino-2-deoxyglucuronate dehydrogenase
VLGQGFIFPKHKEAIDSVGGKIIDIAEKESDWRRVVKRTKANWVVILTPNNLHYEMIVGAVNAGKNVLCEKPLVLHPGQCEILSDVERVQQKHIYTVLQLRYLPILKEIVVEDNNDIRLDINVHRDEDYYKSWKGSPKESGGLLTNIGIHYFDLIINKFGEPTEIFASIVEAGKASGAFWGDNYQCRFEITTNAPKDKQKRTLTVNNKIYNLSSSENLHKFVYRDLVNGKGLSPNEALKSIKLINKLYAKKF